MNTMIKSKINFRPLFDYILVDPIDRNNKELSIIIPEKYKKPPIEGIVLAKGPGKRNRKGEIKKIPLNINDKIVFSSSSGISVEINKNKYLIIRISDVIGTTND